MSRKIKWFMRSGVLLVVLMLSLIAACAPAKPAPSPAATASPTPTLAAEKHAWRFTSMHPASEITTIAQNHFADLVKERSGGRLQIIVTPGAALVSIKDQHRAVKDGIIDGGSVNLAEWVGEFPLGEGAESPPFSLAEATYDPKAPQIKEMRAVCNRELEAKGWNMMLLWSNPLGPGGLFLREPIKSLYADMKGRKIRTAGGSWNPILAEVGATPVSGALTEVYLAIQRRIFDGATAGWASYETQKFYEVAPYALVFEPPPRPTLFCPVGVSLQSWNKLSKDLQKIVLESSEEMDVWAFEHEKAFLKEQAKRLESVGATLIPVPAEDVNRIMVSTIPAWQAEYVKRTGEPGRQILKLITEMSPFWKRAKVGFSIP